MRVLCGPWSYIMSYSYVYPHPAITADCVLFGLDGPSFNVLLVARSHEPFKGYWALPGGFMEIDETVETCAQRELAEETGVKGIRIEQLHTFSKVDRDPRERVVSVVFMSYVRLADCSLKAGDDASDARWFALEHLPELAFDHADVLRLALRKHRHRLCAFDGDPELLATSWA